MTQPTEVLLVEDSATDMLLTREAFIEAKMKSRLKMVPSAEDAIQYLKREGRFTEAKTPALILLDLNLPGKKGFHVLEWIKGHDKFRTIPVIVLTASGSSMDVSKAYAMGANTFISKPIDIGEFIDVLQNVERYWLGTATLPSRSGM